MLNIPLEDIQFVQIIKSVPCAALKPPMGRLLMNFKNSILKKIVTFARIKVFKEAKNTQNSMKLSHKLKRIL